MHVSLKQLCEDLISFKTITPEDNGCLDYISTYLKNLNFEVEKIIFDDTVNLYAKIGNHKKNLYFAGHTDVVSPGDLKDWKHDPFTPTFEGDTLYGRGTSDMKCAVAAFLYALQNFDFNNSAYNICILLTSDEEGTGKNGIKRMLTEYFKDDKQLIDYCLIGEPSSKEKICDTVKVGARGSANFILEIQGTQGHVAYDKLVLNPITLAGNFIKDVKDNLFKKDESKPMYCNVEFTNINNTASSENVVPDKSTLNFNIRFTNEFHSEEIIKMVEEKCKAHFTKGYKLTHRVSGESFYSEDLSFCNLTAGIIERHLGYKPNVTTEGGTSDGRFLINYCKSLVQIGMQNKTAHKINENVLFSDVEILAKIYRNIIDSLVYNF